MTLLEVRDLTTDLAVGDTWMRAVDNVSFDVERCETVGIVGESGAGKSVLARSIMGLRPRTARLEGSISFDGRSVQSLSPKELRRLWGASVAMVFQDPMTSLNPVRKVGRQIIDPMRFHLGLSRRAARARARELFDLVRIPDPERRLDQYPHELSGGMRQRVGIAIALSCNPTLLIADEPTTALDVTVQRDILDLLASVQRELGMSMILITHDLAVVASRADRIIVLYAGQIVESATVAEFFSSTDHPYSAALMASIPRLDQRERRSLPTIAGRPPNLLDLPRGCRFAPRCTRASDLCRSTEPDLLTVDTTGHRCACWHPLVHRTPAAPSTAPFNATSTVTSTASSTVPCAGQTN